MAIKTPPPANIKARFFGRCGFCAPQAKISEKHTHTIRPKPRPAPSSPGSSRIPKSVNPPSNVLERPSKRGEGKLPRMLATVSLIQGQAGGAQFCMPRRIKFPVSPSHGLAAVTGFSSEFSRLAPDQLPPCKWLETKIGNEALSKKTSKRGTSQGVKNLRQRPEAAKSKAQGRPQRRLLDLIPAQREIDKLDKAKSRRVAKPGMDARFRLERKRLPR